MSLVDAALSGARRTPETVAARSAFIVGNVGKLGGELLGALLESPQYSRVAVAVCKPMRVAVPKLEAVRAPADLGWVPDDVYLCIEPESLSFWKLATPYVALTSPLAAEIAAAMRGKGARRLAVLTPLEALLQLGTAPAIRSVDELAIVNAGYERVVVLRPIADGEASQPAGMLRSVGEGVVRVLASYMTPRSLEPVRRRQAAQAAIDSLGTLPDGVHIIGAARLRELVGDPLDEKRRY